MGESIGAALSVSPRAGGRPSRLRRTLKAIRDGASPRPRLDPRRAERIVDPSNAAMYRGSNATNWLARAAATTLLDFLILNCRPLIAPCRASRVSFLDFD